MSLSRAFGSGVFGACFLTLLHEVLRRIIPDAPRMDILGKQALALVYQETGHEPPGEEKLYFLSMAGDLVSNAAYYSLVGVGAPERAEIRGALLGLGAGVGSVVVPKYLVPEYLELDERASSRTPVTALMTVGLYVAGGLAAAAAYRLLEEYDE